MKNYLALTLTILSIMCFIAVFNAKGVESYKLNKGYIHRNSEDIVAKNMSLKVIATSEFEKNKDNNKISESLKQPVQIPIGQDGAIIQNTLKNPINQVGMEHTQTPNVGTTSRNEKRIIDPLKPMVALTFDDGPHPKFTIRILACLERHKGLATFFVLGSRAEKYKGVIKSITQNGNQIGNHTYDHRQLTKLSSKAITSEVTKTANIVQDITNIKPRILRPTYGSVNSNVKLYSGVPLILWSIDTLDWKTRNEKMVINEVLNNVKGGDIILMHDIYKTTASAAEVIIKELSIREYQLVTIDELYTSQGIDLVNGKVYENAYRKSKRTIK